MFKFRFNYWLQTGWCATQVIVTLNYIITGCKLRELRELESCVSNSLWRIIGNATQLLKNGFGVFRSFGDFGGFQIQV